jgi:hypothetical protein
MFKYIISSFFIIFLFSGCSNSKENLDYSTKEYKGISKDAILNAAKRVIKLSDEEFTISSKRNAISAIRAIPKNKGFTVDINIKELELNATMEDETTVLKLLIKQKDDIFSDNQKILKGAVHNLFWDRVDYILGLKKSWYSCTEYRMLLNFDGFFCDLKYNANVYPSENNIIKDIAIAKPVVIEEATINPSVIDLSSLEGILLPFKNPPKEEDVTIADINTSELFSLIQNGIDTNSTLEKIIDSNTLTLEKNITEENSTNTFIEDLNTTILEYIEQPLPDELNSSNVQKEIAVFDINQTMEEKIPEVNTMVIPPKEIIPTEEINSTKPPLDITIQEEPLTKELPNMKTSLDNDKEELTDFSKIFMTSNPKSYTINLATVYTKEQSDAFILENNIKDTTFSIGFINDSDNKYYVKIMYGIYETREDALQAIKSFPSVLKVNKPAIEIVGKKQTLFTKKGENLSVR